MTKPLHLYGPFPQSIKGVEQVFDYSRMVGRFFEPDEKICLIFDNVKYDKLRELPEFAEYHDMPEAREWADAFEQGIKGYGFNEDQIYRHRDADYNSFEDAIRCGENNVEWKITQNAEQGRRTLLLCFYAGHGVTDDNELNVLCNSNERAGEYEYIMESVLNACIEVNGVYVIGLFACGREQKPVPEDDEANRGGTETNVARPIEDLGQSIMIHAT